MYNVRGRLPSNVRSRELTVQITALDRFADGKTKNKPTAQQILQKQQKLEKRSGNAAPEDLQGRITALSRRANELAQRKQKGDGGLDSGDADADQNPAFTQLRPYIDSLLDISQSRSGASATAASIIKEKTGRGRGAKRGVILELRDAYLDVWLNALELELKEETEESEQRLKVWSRSRLEAEGYALFGLTAAEDGSLYRDTIVKMYVPSSPLPYHSLSRGDVVLVTAGDGGRSSPGGDNSIEALVLDFSSRWIRVAVPSDRGKDIRGAGWRVDLYANSISYERARQAVERFSQGKGWAEEDETVGSTAGPSVACGLAGLRKRSGASSDNEEDGSSSAGAVALRELLLGVVPQGANIEVLASQSPSWVKGAAGRERLVLAKKALAEAGAEEPGSRVGALVSSQDKQPSNGDALVSSQDKQHSNGDLIANINVDAEPAESVLMVRKATRVGRQGDQGGLNKSQVKAAELALGRRLTMWQGPPGTGKTSTLLRFISSSLVALPEDQQILATAASNVAVDNLVTGLLRIGVDIVRVGQPAKVSPELRRVTLEARMSMTAAGQAASRLRIKAAGLQGQQAWGLIQKAMVLEGEAAEQVLSSCRVVAATCVGAGDPRLQRKEFALCVLDEATQATEPHSLIPILRNAESLLLVGDPQQLPPTVRSRQAEELGLGISLFERLQKMGLQPLLLDTQYRMHPQICEFPSAAFYKNLLKSWPSTAERPAAAGFPWPNPQVPVCFIAVTGDQYERRTTAASDQLQLFASSSRQCGKDQTRGSDIPSYGYSYYNEREAMEVVSIISGLVKASERGEAKALKEGAADIGIVTPYNGQVRYMQRHLPGAISETLGRNKGQAVSAGMRKSGGRGGRVRRLLKEGDLDGSTAEGLKESLEIKSVDGFQGREKEVIVFSAVRSNAQGSVGFLSDYRRLNVAITRARRGLIVVGDPITLMRDPTWARWLRWVQGLRAAVVASNNGAPHNT
ncbi:hypothetical protein CEUSTIGMA_g935.t1 [Chlamydomonas eustigma]|uniref:AAA+ ATPase domain-containing protein n=1 Tax=Chlamydomonas eustigma TaxID=1157962 RepID=A0A250WRP5_9CHLO|nr:hypothetical protein CEUSTIGMA_g935.t1 [Chlamydomonas eustigma]|eukprot:GAX73483.1 hypothetical protein CEUSTIGMA_g935.t1 [Chlamydomonas eustigma]